MKQKIKAYPYISIGLTIINIILFLLCTFTGNLLYNKGGLSPYSFFEKGEYYRVLTCMFLHVDIEHLVSNMLLLCGLGAMIEKGVGHITYAVAYFITGFGANIASLWYKLYVGHYDALSVGASGAISGLLGVLLVVALLPGVYMPSATPMRILVVIGFSIYNDMQQTGVDVAGHIGGILCGIVFATLVFGVLRKGFSQKKEQPNNIEDGGYYED